MRILIHGINFSPELTGIGKYSGELAAWLTLRGHQVRVVTASPYYPQWQVVDGYANTWHVQRLQCAGAAGEVAGEVLVYRCPLWVPVKPSGLKRLLHLASFALSSLPIILRQIFWRPDVVLVIEPTLFCAPQAWLVARLSGGKAWLHIQDFEVDAAFDLGLVKGAGLRRLVAAVELFMMRRFNRVSTISQRMLERLRLKGVEAAQCVFFPNWVDIHAIAPGKPVDVSVMQKTALLGGFAPRNDGGDVVQVSGLPDNAAPLNDGVAHAAISGYRAELGIATDAVVALYSGNMGGKQGLEILAQVALLLRYLTQVVFVFCGNGAERAMLEQACSGLRNVRFLDLQPQERLGELLCMADIHLLPQRAAATDLVMPSKLTGMLASARPVVATASAGSELAELVAGAEQVCGVVVPPENPEQFASAIAALANDADLRAKLGAAGRQYAVVFLDKEAVLCRFEVELTRLVMP